MKGHVRKRGAKWCFVLDLGKDETTGKRQQKWFSGFATKKEAEKAMAEKITEINQGTFIEPSKEMFASFLTSWLENKKMSVRSSTFRNYEWLINNHILPHLGKYELSKLNPMHIESFYRKLKKDESALSDEVISKIHTIINAVLTRAHERGFVAKNVAKLVDKPRFSKKKMEVWNEKEVLQFLDVAREDRLYIAFFLAITTGMRRGEILGLRWKDIDFENGEISVQQTLSNKGDELQEPKTKSAQRSIALPEQTVAELKKHKRRIAQEKLLARSVYQDNDLVVCTSVGTKVLPRNLIRTYYRLLKKADVPKIRFHDLRHSHATLLLKKGVHPKIAQERLGHANIRITLDTYSHVLPNMQSEAAKQFGDSLFNKDDDNKNGKSAL
ncbi:site-specific integrase [Brevibacillus sp. NSP2.1]|uniref:site-specific integrase n=1 Tax=Brevibacillus sp. NSP2.1 TaxID=3003229 RepID=UPI0004014697|nr:site-specific integrase [Brevibacillus sp. NSP2.1]QHZ55773.1 site-specific integrase [Brevibacillus sp. NSP2.1]